MHLELAFLAVSEKVRAKIAILKMDLGLKVFFFFLQTPHPQAHTRILAKWGMGLKEKGKEKEAR